MLANLEKRKTSILKWLFAVLLFLFPLIFKDQNYIILICCFIEIYIIAVSGLDVVFGYCGQISMGHAGFYAIGAYGSAMLHEYFGIPVVLSMILSSILAVLIAIIVAYPASKLVFHFLSLSTIAFGEIIYLLISHSPNNITGNYNGFFSDYIDLGIFKINSNIRFYYFGLICVFIFMLIKINLVKSKYGRAFIAIRENTHAADGMGINVRKYKVIAFATSAFYTAFAGSMYVHLVRFIHPDTFVRQQSVLFLTMLLFGGAGSTVGPIIGTIFISVLNELLRPLEQYQMLFYGIILLITIILLPGGLYREIRSVINKIKYNFVSRKEVKQYVES